MPLLHRTALAVALLAVAPLASAASPQSADFEVSIDITNECNITATDMTFPTSTTLASAINATSTVSVECSNQGPIEISFNKGTSAGASLTTRKMEDSFGNTIDYSLYRDGDNALLGDGTTESSVTIDTTSTGGTDDFTVHGTVPGGQGPKPTGTYSDTITASVTF